VVNLDRGSATHILTEELKIKWVSTEMNPFKASG
jgi:hypothetical protein